ncbi:MAG: flagellar basal body L-ring protein FlgH [Proteobacteria bacterium]|nr:flagellar basal body L-ring protein FlgH [Pseudomonadota bacterium]
MPRNYNSLTKKLATLLLGGTMLAGCNALERLANVGSTPDMSEIKNPTHTRGYKPVSMPMPKPIVAHREANSLWRPGSRAFFKDLRASEIGDIVTVIVNIDDTAKLENETDRTRTNTEDASASAFLGYQTQLSKILPEAIDPTNLVDLDSATRSNGKGEIERTEDIEVKVAAIVTQLLPNGNLVIHGRQETRVNFEVRELQIAGVIRPQDIDNQNTVSFEKIAEARLAYGGRGHITDVQQPRYGQQIVDVIFPF